MKEKLRMAEGTPQGGDAMKEKLRMADDSSFRNCAQYAPASCSAACLFGMDVVDFTAKLSRGNIDGALRTYRNAVGFPRIISRICPAPCKNACPFSDNGSDPIDMPMLERASVAYASSTAPRANHVPKKTQHVAIIGAGLSGLSLALRMAGNKNYDVTVYERSDRIGGSLWDQMEPEIFLAEFEEQLQHSKYTLKLNHEITSLDQIQADAIYVATGKGGETFGVLADTPADRFGSDKHPGVFIGGEVRGCSTAEAGAHGIAATLVIETYLKIASMAGELPKNAGTPLVAAGRDFTNSPAVAPTQGTEYTKEEALAEAARCRHCVCDACTRNCDLLTYFKREPLQYQNEVEGTVHPSSWFTNKIAMRMVMSCYECGQCTPKCPMGVDICGYTVEEKRILCQNGDTPPVFHDFFVRDMEFSGNEAGLIRTLPGQEKPEYAFFPGCQLGATDPDYVTGTFALVQKHLPGTALFLRCCGAPAVWSDDEARFAQEFELLQSQWEQLGKPKLILACPSCEKFFGEYLPHIPTVNLYTLLAQWGEKPAVDGAQQTVSVFDPCAARGKHDMQDAVRTIAENAGYTLQPMAHERDNARCCGWGGQIHIANPAFHDYIVNKSANVGEAPYLVYCINCRDTFVEDGKPVRHVLDVLLGLEDDRPLPTWTKRRENRLEVKARLLKEYWNEEAPPVEKSPVNLIMSDEIKAALSRDHVLEEDIANTVAYCEQTGRKITDPEKGTFIGHCKVGVLTCWAEYKPTAEPDTFEVVAAYNHRMSIIGEEDGAWKKEN